MPRAAMSVATSTRDLAVAERGESPLALALRLVAVDGFGADAGLRETARDPVGAVLGAGEDQHALDRLVAQHFDEHSRASSALSTRMIRCSIFSAVVATGVTATFAGSRSMRRQFGDSRGMVAENNNVCRSFGSLAMMCRMSWMKPMSSMRSASSSTKHLDRASRTCPWLDQIEQPPGRGDEHVDAVAQRAHLRAHADAAEDQRA